MATRKAKNASFVQPVSEAVSEDYIVFLICSVTYLGAAYHKTRPGNDPLSANIPAWHFAKRAAHRVREMEGCGLAALGDRRLAGLAGLRESGLSEASTTGPLDFVMRRSSEDRVVFRSWRRESRRFALARLLIDRLYHGQTDLLSPAVLQSSTYRQQMQRAFAAELLAPIDGILEFCRGDYSEECQSKAAVHFAVSPWVISWQLMNSGDIETDDPWSFEVQRAA